MTAAQPVSGSEVDAIRSKRQGKSKSDHSPWGQVTAHIMFTTVEEPEQNPNKVWAWVDNQENHTLQVTVFVHPLLKSLTHSNLVMSLHSLEENKYNKRKLSPHFATVLATHFLVLQYSGKKSKANTNKADTSRITVILYAIERQTKSVLCSMVKQPPTALLLSHTETISHNDFSASCPGVCLS